MQRWLVRIIQGEGGSAPKFKTQSAAVCDGSACFKRGKNRLPFGDFVANDLVICGNDEKSLQENV